MALRMLRYCTVCQHTVKCSCALCIQVWDLTAGKLLHEFRHEDAITAIEYHPSEFILATSSADRTVKWWDLETAELIDTAGPETTGGFACNLPDC